MTPSKIAKASGLKSLTEVSNIAGVSLQTLTNWHKNKPELFSVVITGCVNSDVCTSCESVFESSCHNDRPEGAFCDSCLENPNG